MTAATDTDLVALVDAVDVAVLAYAAARMNLGSHIKDDQAVWDYWQDKSTAAFGDYYRAVDTLRLAARDAQAVYHEGRTR